MKNTYIKLFFIFLLYFIVQNIFALPGVRHCIPDASGQFVYYKDDSFKRESYIGILFYDESTYSLRYYAPAYGNGKEYVPSKEIQIGFTIDPNQNYLKLTGEKIVTSVTPDDVDLINYIHDIFYELNSRRIKADEVTEKISLYQDYPQFGGEVIIEYDPIIPIFNLNKIISNKKEVFTLITAGQLISAQDTSFTDFKGIPDVRTDKSTLIKLSKKTKKENFSFQPDNKLPVSRITLDSQWKKEADNLFALNTAAMLSMNIGVIPEKVIELMLKRSLILGRENVYPDLRNTSITENDDGFLAKTMFYYPNSKSFSIDYKKLVNGTENISGILTLTVYFSTYSKNQKYFESILNSYSFN